MKKIINNEMFFFSPFMSFTNREELCINRENRHPKSTIFSPLVFHRLRLLDERQHYIKIFLRFFFRNGSVAFRDGILSRIVGQPRAWVIGSES